MAALAGGRRRRVSIKRISFVGSICCYSPGGDVEMVWGGMACHWRFARASNRAMLQIVGRKYCHGVGGLK